MAPTARAMSDEAQLEELHDRMQGLDIQASVYQQIDITLWDQDISPDEDNKAAVTTYVARFLSSAHFGNDQGYEILGYFQDHFEGWTENIWELVPVEYKRALKKLLRRRDPPNWPEQEFLDMVFDEKTSAYRRQTALMGSNASTSSHRSQSPPPTAITPQAPVIATPLPSSPTPPSQQNPAPTTQDTPIPTSLTTYPTTYRFQRPDLVQPITQPLPEPPSEPMPIDAYTKLPPDDIPNAAVNSDVQQKFMKLWDKEKSYTGEPYDLLDDKLRIFMSICYNIQVKPSQFHALFPRILTGRAEMFYVEEIKWTTTFRKAYDSIKQHFDTEVNHIHYYTNWTTTTFNSIRAQDATKTLHEVLQLLFDKLRLCQRALGPEYAGNLPLRTTLINACRGVPELEYALFKPAEKIETLFADLRSSVETHLARQTTSHFFQNPDGSFDHTDPQQQYYLDRRYHNNRARGRYGYLGQRPNRGYGRSYNRGSYRPQGYNNNTSDRTDRAWTKKCFVCGREGCWSTKHSAEERQKAKDQYVARYQFTGTQPPNFTAYLIDYEGHELDELTDDDIWEEPDNSTNDHQEQ
ncbi:hypothetical protein HIM_11080 [Hirsutella minnesotensis 3608]|uniref:Uncharacterized protein n=1 Tax=Hirsutella minnesotensis 3608 TaxID=1043627 RepID=A0A0F7ZRF8_9HYPO|nr:hypothetical protein HIM_11080 [Hirsutella minnesotensis 3608]